MSREVAHILYQLVKRLKTASLMVRVIPKQYTIIKVEEPILDIHETYKNKLVLEIRFNWSFKRLEVDIKLREGSEYISFRETYSEKTLIEILEELRKLIEKDYKLIDSKRYDKTYELLYQLKELSAIALLEDMKKFMKSLQQFYGFMEL